MIILSIITAHKGDYSQLLKTADSVRSVFGKFQEVEHLIVDATVDFRTIPELNRGGTLQFKSDDTGIFEGMNRGFKMSRGRFCLFLNTGDTLSSDSSVHLILATLRESNNAWFDISSFVELSPGERVSWKNPTRRKLYWGLNSFCHQGQILHREVLSSLGLFDSNSLVADWKLLFQIRESFESTRFENLSVTCQELSFSNQYSLYRWARSIHAARQDLWPQNNLLCGLSLLTQLLLATFLFFRKKATRSGNFYV